MPPPSTPGPNVSSLANNSVSSSSNVNLQNTHPHTSIAPSNLPFPPFGLPPGANPQMLAGGMDPMMLHLFNQSLNQSLFRYEQEDREKKEREIKEAKERELKENELRKFAALTGQIPQNLYDAQLLELRRYALAGLQPNPQALAALAASQQSLQNSIAANQANAAAGHPGGFPPGMNPLAHGGNPTSQQQQQQQMNTNSNSSAAAAEALHNERIQNELKMQHSAALANAAHLANLHHADPAITAQLMAAGQLSNLQPNLAQSSQQAQSQQNALGGQPNQPQHMLGQPNSGSLENNQQHPNLGGHPMFPPGFNPATLARGPNPALFSRPEHLNHPGAGLLRPHASYDEQALAQQVGLV